MRQRARNLYTIQKMFCIISKRYFFIKEGDKKMGLHDMYFTILSGSQESRDYRNGSVELDEKFRKSVKENYKIKFTVSDAHIKEMLSRMPESYRPSAERIQAQIKVSEKLHDEIFDTAFELEFNKKFAALDFSKYAPQYQPSRGMQRFYMYVSEYGTEENKAKLNDILDRVYKNRVSIDEAMKSELSEDDKQAFIEYSREEYEKVALELKNFGREIAVSEIRKSAEEVPKYLDLIKESDSPEKVLENYKQIRTLGAYFLESQGFLSDFEDLFDPDEYKKMEITLGSTHNPGHEFLNRAGSIANPQLAKNFDMEEIKTLSDDFGIYVMNATTGFDWDDVSVEEQKVIVSMAGHNGSVFAEWTSKICSQYGLQTGDIDIYTFDGKRQKFTQDVMAKLYEDGLPFYAMPKNAPFDPDNLSAVLCQPTAGHHLACGKKEIEAIDVSDKGKCTAKRPSGLAFAWDSIISSIKPNWRVSSVKKYEDELALFNKEADLRDIAKGAKNLFNEKESNFARKYGLKTLGKTEADVVKKKEEIFLKNAKMEEEQFLKDSFNYDKDELAEEKVNDKIGKMIENLRVETNKARDLASVSSTPGHTSNFADYFVKKLVLDDISKMKTSNEKSDMKTISRMIHSIDSAAKQKLLNETINEVLKDNLYIIHNPEELFPLVEKAYAEKCAPAAEKPEIEDVKEADNNQKADDAKVVNNQKADDGIAL